MEGGPEGARAEPGRSVVGSGGGGRKIAEFRTLASSDFARPAKGQVLRFGLDRATGIHLHR